MPNHASRLVTSARPSSFVLLVFLLLGLLPGCQPATPPRSQGPAQDPTLKIRVNSQPSEEQQAKLLAAKEALFNKLSNRLMEVMAAQGPAVAIDICKLDAPTFAEQVGKEHHVLIGRTGVRLRNPKNLAPYWAQQLVTDRLSTPVFASLSNGHSIALLPIKLQSQCLMCHGPADSLLPDVKKKLASQYPLDQATGFSEGELRGWFWIESLD